MELFMSHLPPSKRLPALVAVISVILLASGCSREHSKPTGPNIILVSIDSLRAANLGAYGYERDTTPFIDSLANRGVRFENTISTTSWTLPAHAALFTGLYDSTHGVVDNGRKLEDRFVTLAELLQGLGYETAGFFGGPYLHPVFGLDQGFDLYQSCMTSTHDDVSGKQIERQARMVDAPSHGDVTGPRTVSEVEKWIAAGVEQPYFLFLHLWDVHYDYIPPQEHLDLFDPDYTGDLTGEDFSQNNAVNPKMDPRDLEHLIARYDAEIRFTDTILSQIIDALEAASMMERTLVVVTADHGEEFFEHQGKGHQRTLFDEVIRVPLIFYWPGKLVPGQVITDQVRLIDLLPTLVRIAGYEGPLEIQGRDLRPLLAGGEMAQIPALSELLVDGGSMRALRTNEAKVIRWSNRSIPILFRLGEDPVEIWATGLTDEALSDLTPEERFLVTELLRAESEGLPIDQEGDGALELDPEIRKRLESLGYLDD
jgi:arylsulfatase A-like enzyme